MAFVPALSRSAVWNDSMTTTSTLSMGLFDAFSKAFENTDYGPPPEKVSATARHILVRGGTNRDEDVHQEKCPFKIVLVTSQHVHQHLGVDH